MEKKSQVQLNMWVDEEVKTALAQWAKEPPYHSMGDVIETLVRAEVSRKSGHVVEQQSLPVIREIVQTELRKTVAQLRTNLREDMALEFTHEFKEITRKSDNRLAALIMRTARDAAIVRRLVWVVLSKAYGPDFAMRAYEDSKEKAGKELANRPAREKTEEDA